MLTNGTKPSDLAEYRAADQSAKCTVTYGISTDRVCLEIEHIFYDAADDDVPRHTVTPWRDQCR
ncbi:hypothetical protein ACFU8Q_20915 [Streptomyces sp. NPDC057543]|uniref:hypothetical protein n=1 Tax=Streptomyces sp. NPDC057543 TaxID=3346163 RepID=UPI0036AFD042